MKGKMLMRSSVIDTMLLSWEFHGSIRFLSGIIIELFEVNTFIYLQ